MKIYFFFLGNMEKYLDIAVSNDLRTTKNYNNMLLTKKSAQQKLHILVKKAPNTIVELGVNHDETGEANINIKTQAKEVHKWLGDQKTIFSSDIVSLKIEGGKYNFDKGVKFQVRYLYIPQMMPKIHSFEVPSKAVEFYKNTSKSVYCANVEADFDINKFLEL